MKYNLKQRIGQRINGEVLNNSPPNSNFLSRDFILLNGYNALERFKRETERFFKGRVRSHTTNM